MAIDGNNRKVLYRKLLNDPATQRETSRFSFNEWERKLSTDAEAIGRLGEFAVQKGWVKSLGDYADNYISGLGDISAPAPAPVRPAQEAKPVASVEEKVVTPLERTRQLARQGGLGVVAVPPAERVASLTDITREQALTPVPAPFQFKSEKELQQSALSPVFLDNKIAEGVLKERKKAEEKSVFDVFKTFNGQVIVANKQTGDYRTFGDINEAQSELAKEGIPITDEGLIMPTKEKERKFQKLSAEEQEAAIQRSTGGQLGRDKAKEKKTFAERWGLPGDISKAAVAKTKNMFNNLASGIKNYLNYGLPDVEGAEEFSNRQLYLENQAFKQELFKKLSELNVETDAWEQIKNGNWDRVPESVTLTVVDVLAQIAPVLLTRGNISATYFQTLPDAYAASVEAKAKSSGKTPLEVIESGDDDKEIAQLSSLFQALIEKVETGIVSESIRSVGFDKAVKNWVLEKLAQKTGKRLAKGIGSTAAFGAATLGEGLAGATQEATSVAQEAYSGDQNILDALGENTERILAGGINEAIGAAGLIGVGKTGGAIGQYAGKTGRAIGQYVGKKIASPAPPPAGAAPVTGPMTQTLPDGTIRITVNSIDEIPEQYRDRAKKNWEVKKSTLPFGLGEKFQVEQWQYTLTPEEAQEMDVQDVEYEPVSETETAPVTEYEEVTQGELDAYLNSEGGELSPDRRAGVEDDIRRILSGEMSLDDITDERYKTILMYEMPDAEAMALMEEEGAAPEGEVAVEETEPVAEGEEVVVEEPAPVPPAPVAETETETAAAPAEPAATEGEVAVPEAAPAEPVRETPQAGSVGVGGEVEELANKEGFKVKFYDGKGKEGGVHTSGGNEISINKNTTKGNTTFYLKGVEPDMKGSHTFELPTDKSILFHEIGHKMFSNNSELGHKILKRLKEYKKSDDFGHPTEYSAVADDLFDATMMDFFSFYKLAPKELKSSQPRVFELMKEWEDAYKNSSRGGKKDVRIEVIDFENESETINTEQAAKDAEEIAKNNNVNILRGKDLNSVAVDKEGKTVGGLWTEVNGDEFSFDVAIDKTAQGQGVGEKLVKDAISQFNNEKEANPNLKYKVDVTNPIMEKLLSKYGFKVSERVGDHTIMEHPTNKPKAASTLKTPQPVPPAAPAPKGGKKAAPETGKETERAAKKIEAISPTNLSPFKGIVSKDPLKPKMQGVYFDKANQKIVATDGMNMVVIDRDVKSDVVINPKTGQVIKETFPDYQAAIPTNYTKGVGDVSINDLLGKLDAIIKGDKERTENAFATITFDGEQVGITPKVLKAGLKALKDLGYETASIEYQAPNKPLLIKTKDGKALLLTMPVYLREDKAENAISIGEFALEDIGKPKAEPAPETVEAPQAVPPTKTEPGTGTGTEGKASLFAPFETRGEAGIKARAALREQVGKARYDLMENVQKNAEKILRTLEAEGKVSIKCP